MRQIVADHFCNFFFYPKKFAAIAFEKFEKLWRRDCKWTDKECEQKKEVTQTAAGLIGKVQIYGEQLILIEWIQKNPSRLCGTSREENTKNQSCTTHLIQSLMNGEKRRLYLALFRHTQLNVFLLSRKRNHKSMWHNAARDRSPHMIESWLHNNEQISTVNWNSLQNTPRGQHNCKTRLWW